MFVVLTAGTHQAHAQLGNFKNKLKDKATKTVDDAASGSRKSNSSNNDNSSSSKNDDRAKEEGKPVEESQPKQEAASGDNDAHHGDFDAS